MDDAYNVGSTIGETEAAFAAAIEAEIDLGVLKNNEHWKAAAVETKELHYLNLVFVCECGKRHRLRFGPDER